MSTGLRAVDFLQANLRLKELTCLDEKMFIERGRGVVVAVIDSGVNRAKDFLSDHLLPGWDFIESRENYTDRVDHGTAIAGIIIQIASAAKILPIAITNERGIAATKVGVDALVYALRQGAQVINISMSFSERHLTEARNIVGQKCFEQSLIVISAGNSPFAAQAMNEPWPNVIIVGASVLQDPPVLTSYSVYGKHVDISCPVGSVGNGLLTLSAKADAPRLFNGTSAACGVISAAAALVKERYPKSLGANLKAMLLKGCAKIKGLQVNQERLINFARLLEND